MHPSRSRARAVAFAAIAALVLLTPAVAAHHPHTHTASGDPPEHPFQDRFVHRQWDVDATFARWEAEWPDFVERFTIGKSTLGVDILGVRVTDLRVSDAEAGLSTGEKVRVYLDGGHHGNEYLGTELVMYWLTDVLTRAGNGDEDALRLLATHDIRAVPIVNVDGNLADTRKNANQVDLNRNYPYEWGGEGAGTDPTSLSYRGPEPLSEVESRANAEYGAAFSPDIWVTMHTGIAELYWPWGYTHDNPPDHEMFIGLKEPFEAATNGRIVAMQAAELYVAAGATDDYGYGAVGAPAFTFEVHEDQFIPVYGEPIPEVVSDQLAGLEWLVLHARHMGAWVEPVLAEDGRLLLENEGWGPATNVTVTVDGEPRAVADIPAGGSVAVDVPKGTTEASVTYKALLVDASRERTHHLDAASLQGTDGARTIPPPAAMWAALALALTAALVLPRMRGR